jgi:hypothetical protein
VHQQERADAHQPISSTTRIAMPVFVAIVLAQGCQPRRIKPSGNLCRKTNAYMGPMPNITSGDGTAGRALAPPGQR